MRTTADKMSLPTPATLRSASMSCGSPSGYASLRSRRGILLPIGARRAAEKLLHGTANMIPTSLPDLAIQMMSATARGSKISSRTKHPEEVCSARRAARQTCRLAQRLRRGVRKDLRARSGWRRWHTVHFDERPQGLLAKSEVTHQVGLQGRKQS